MAEDSKIHTGHRRRMRSRVAENGFSSLEPHEALECLLYITNARKNTNRMAHELIDRFGDFAGVLDASEEDLMTVEGVGPATARMLHLMPDVCRYYTQCRTGRNGCLKTTEQLAEHLMGLFAGAAQERALLLALDSRSRVRATLWLKDGTSDRVSLAIKDVVAAALKGGTDRVVLCHNHPNGVALPSREDIQATENIVRALGLVHVLLRDHIILTETEYFSMREENRLLLRRSGTVFWLDRPLEDIMSTNFQEGRPLLTEGRDALQRLAAARRALYAACAHHCIPEPLLNRAVADIENIWRGENV